MSNAEGSQGYKQSQSFYPRNTMLSLSSNVWLYVHMLVLYRNSCKNRAVFGRLYYRSSLCYTVSSVCRLSVDVVCDVLYCGETVHPSEKLPEGVNRKPGSKSWFLGSPPYFYFRFGLYGHRDGRLCLIFARTSKQSVLDGRNWLSSSKPCAYYRTVWSEFKLEVVLATIIDLERCK